MGSSRGACGRPVPRRRCSWRLARPGGPRWSAPRRALPESPSRGGAWTARERTAPAGAPGSGFRVHPGLSRFLREPRLEPGDSAGKRTRSTSALRRGVRAAGPCPPGLKPSGCLHWTPGIKSGASPPSQGGDAHLQLSGVKLRPRACVCRGARVPGRGSCSCFQRQGGAGKGFVVECAPLSSSGYCRKIENSEELREKTILRTLPLTVSLRISLLHVLISP